MKCPIFEFTFSEPVTGKRFWKLSLLYSLILIFPTLNLNAQPSPEPAFDQSDSITVRFFSEKQKPSGVPVIPWLSRETPYYPGGMFGRSVSDNDYRPYGEGSFVKINGSSEQTFVITTGVWRLLVGDRPVIGLDQRSTGGAYARPGILPHLQVKGKIRLQVKNAETEKFLENFSKITTILSAGEPKWVCEDNDLGLKVTLTAHAFLEDFGCALIARVEPDKNEHPELNWYYENAEHTKDSQSFTEFSFDKYTRIFVGNTDPETTYHNGIARTVLSMNNRESVTDTLICVWGYSDYDRDEVEKAYRRLWFRPFPSKEWADEMQNKWFHHWIGRGLDPEKKFIRVMNNPGEPISKSKEFWQAMRNRVRIRTGDARFDNAVQSLGSRLISNYEYPGYPHGSNYMKYGKINCGLYAHDAAGFHDEVASTLRFITGTQCVKGRQRYIMPDFLISQWAEEINPYYIDQIWYHYRWTGDREFLFGMWPSARRALEHLISTSDPDHDGFFTGIYETWNGDAKDRGGRSALWTGMCANALKIGYHIAELFGDVDWTRESQAPKPADNDFRIRYKRLLSKAEAAYESLYNKKTGSYSSGDWESELRNTPDNEESNYAIWRGWGDPLRNYTSMRFIRDNYHQKAANGVFEFSNKNWPVCWSNHYDSFSDAMSSVASAAMANDINNFWPLLKTAAEGIYTRPQCTVLAGGASQLSLESDQMFLMALLDNIFGIKPYFGENLLVIRPSFPDAWKNPEIELPDVSYSYAFVNNVITMNVKTPVARILRVELPVRQEVKEVMINDGKADFKTRKEVNCCRLIIETDAALQHEIKVVLTPADFKAEGNGKCILNKTASFRFSNADLIKVENPQINFGAIKIKGNEIEVTPEITGRYTLFAELKKGNVSWYQPIELDVREPWSVIEEYKAWDGEAETPSVMLTPSVENENQTLQFRLVNNTNEKMTGDMTVEINGRSILKDITILPSRSGKFEISLKDVWDKLSPGTIPFKVKFRNDVKESHAIAWQINIRKSIEKGIIPLCINKYYNISLAQLYGTEYFKWRTDYTGAAVGVDWRDTLYVDSQGYRLFVPPTSVISYGILPEQHSPAWWSAPSVPDSLRFPVPFPFIEHGQDKKNLIALVNTENNRDIPGKAVIELKNPVKADKLYLLTANLTKTSKSYYPAAEVEVFYEDGKSHLVQLTPPYNMPSMVQAFCPGAYRVPLGKIENNQVLHDRMGPGLSVTDIITDPERKIIKVVFKCVTSETVLGIIGISLLEAD